MRYLPKGTAKSASATSRPRFCPSLRRTCSTCVLSAAPGWLSVWGFPVSRTTFSKCPLGISGASLWATLHSSPSNTLTLSANIQGTFPTKLDGPNFFRKRSKDRFLRRHDSGLRFTPRSHSAFEMSFQKLFGILTWPKNRCLRRVSSLMSTSVSLSYHMPMDFTWDRVPSLAAAKAARSVQSNKKKTDALKKMENDSTALGNQTEFSQN